VIDNGGLMNKEQKKYIKVITYGNFPYGGASANFLRYLALSLTLENRNDIEVLLPTGHYYGNKTEENAIRNGVVENIKYRHLGFLNHPKNYLGKIIDNLIGPFLLLFYLLLQRLKGKLNLIIFYNTVFTNTFLILIAKAITGQNLVIIYPEFYEKPKGKIALLKWYNFHLGIKYLAKYADGSQVMSYYLKDYISSRSKHNMKCLVFPNVMDPKIFDLQNTKPFKENMITIGYTGTPTRKDGVVDLIKSFSILNKKYANTHLLIIGDITNGNSILPDLKILAKELGVIDSITFTGLVPFMQVPELLNSCQILALTRPNAIFAEAGFPTKLGEYFACRKPVIVTSVGDIPKYFKNEEHIILVKPENLENIVDGFEKLIKNEELSLYICNNAYKWMDENLNYRNVTGKLNDFLNSL
jgi:glycosyltransferase involved in cell wall biosynthesis